MNAAVLHNFGEAPRFGQFPEPVPGEGEVIVHIRAAPLKPIDKQLANGTHYGSSTRNLPFVCGIDGAGRLENGSRVLFAMPRAPHGSMAERTVVPSSRCFPVRDDIDDCTAAAVLNPGLSAWASLAWAAKLVPGETVLVLGATGVTGKLAVQVAKLLGAGRVIAAGRNEQALGQLHELGADATIRINDPDRDLAEAFAHEAAKGSFDVIIDYLWGWPTEALLTAITRKDLMAAASRVRLVQVGESVGPTITLPAGALRSSRLEILGSGSGRAPEPQVWIEAQRRIMDYVAEGKLRIDTEQAPLADIEDAWGRDVRGRRLVIIP